MIGLMTHWSAPTRGRVPTRAELCLWALSAHFARRHFGRLVLNTDRAGARLLVDRLGLEADEVRVCLDDFDPGLPAAWALGKVESYRRSAEAGEAFCHVDGDAILWQPPPADVVGAPLFAQHDEWMLREYYPLPEIEPCFRCLPPAVRRCVENRCYPGYNAGVIGGTDCDFFARYARASLETARDPRNGRGPVPCGVVLSIFLEQYFFGAFAFDEGRAVRTLLDSPPRGAKFYSPHHAARRMGFTHYVGNSKRNPKYAPRIFARTREELPGAWERAFALSER